jgi:multiple sugar transport system substrate-binding protein
MKGGDVRQQTRDKTKFRMFDLERLKMKNKSLFLTVLAGLAVSVGIASAQEKVTINFWHTYNEVSPENEMLTETLIPMFEEQHPNIHVETLAQPYNEFRQALLTSMAGGEGPDLARLDIIWSPEFAELGGLLELDTAMDDFQTLADRTFPGPLATNFYNGHYYGLPLDTNTRIWVYNQTVLDAAGIDAPPATIDELREQCAAIQGSGEKVYAFADGGTYGWAVVPWIYSFGGSITNPEGTMATGYLNSPETVAAYTFLKEMIDSGCFAETMRGSGEDVGNMYFTDHAAGLLEGPWMYGIAEAQYPDFEIKAALMPEGPGGSVSVIGGENIAIFANTQHPDEAMEFLRFTQSEEYQQKMSEVGQLTVRSDLIESDFFANHPYYGTFLKQLETAVPRVVNPRWTEMEELLTNVGQMILLGEMEPQEALDMAAAEIDAILQEE